MKLQSGGHYFDQDITYSPKKKKKRSQPLRTTTNLRGILTNLSIECLFPIFIEMCDSKSHAQCLGTLTLVFFLKTRLNQRAALYWECQTHFHAKVIQKSDNAWCQRTADTISEPSQDQRQGSGTKKKKDVLRRRWDTTDTKSKSEWVLLW